MLQNPDSDQQFGVGNERIALKDFVSNQTTYFGGSIEYTEFGGNGVLVWSRSLISFGDSILSTITPNGSGGEYTEFNHPDRLGTRLIRAVWAVIRFIAILVAAIVISAFSFNPFGFLGRVYSRVNEWLNKCNVPDYNGLSQARRDELSQRGVSTEQWDSLRNKARLGYFNIVAAIVSAGLSLIGWLVDWAAGGIRQDRTFFMAGAGATPLLAQVRASSIFRPDIFRGRSHPGYPDSHRQNSFFRSLQLSFNTDGTRFEADIDFFNPNRGLTFIPHLIEGFAHILGRIFGGGSRTNPYNVAYRSSWECK